MVFQLTLVGLVGAGTKDYWSSTNASRPILAGTALGTQLTSAGDGSGVVIAEQESISDIVMFDVER
jgi:hypothetical protein